MPARRACVLAAVLLMSWCLGAVQGDGGNATIKTLEDEFVDGLTGQCVRDASLTCLRRNLFGYVERSLEQRDLAITDSLVFTRSGRAEEEEEAGRGGKSLPEAATAEDALYEKGARFLMDHDVNLRLPETFFSGAVLRFSPRAFEEDGVLIKMEVPDPAAGDRALRDGQEGRLFFHSHSGCRSLEPRSH
jgi:hypothetical protein